MSYVRIWVHIVFSTRNHEQYLSSEIRRNLIEHIKMNCRNKEIYIEGQEEHHRAIPFSRELDTLRKITGKLG